MFLTSNHICPNKMLQLSSQKKKKKKKKKKKLQLHTSLFLPKKKKKIDSYLYFVFCIFFYGMYLLSI